MGSQKIYLDKLARFFQIRNLLLRQALAECLGTLILVVSLCDFDAGTPTFISHRSYYTIVT